MIGSIVLTFIPLIITTSAVEPPHRPCEKINQVSQLTQVVAYSKANKTHWHAAPGSLVSVDFIFAPQENVKKVEYAVFAILDPKGGPGGKPLEVGYGKPEDLCKTLNVTDCTKIGLQKGQTYKAHLVFDVPPTVPKIALEVRFVVRETVTTKRLSRLQKTNWRRHPGKMVFCVKLPVVVV